MTQTPPFMTNDSPDPVRSFSLQFDTNHGMTATDAVYYRISIENMIGRGLRPGVPYTIKINPPREETDGNRTIRTTEVLVVLENHGDAEIGEWAIFRGWASGPPPATLVTFPGKEPAYFANPVKALGVIVYQRVSREGYVRCGGPYYHAREATKEDEAAAMRA